MKEKSKDLAVLFEAGVLVGLLSLLYSYLIFVVLGFYPDFILGDPLVFIFVKNFLVGMLLMLFFRLGYRNINNNENSRRKNFLGILFFIFYGVTALLFFSLGDLIFFRNLEGIAVLVTVDGFIETLIATIPIRLLGRKG